MALAEALPAETYLDTGNRAGFGPAPAHAAAAKTWARDVCATLTGDGPTVAAVRAQLRRRAAAPVPR